MIKCGQCHNRISFPVYKPHSEWVTTMYNSITNNTTAEKHLKGYYPHCPFCDALLVPLNISEFTTNSEEEQ